MRAVVYDPEAPGQLRLGEVAEPEPAADQVVIATAAASINYVDVGYISRALRPGEAGGLDSAGVVVRAAADGTGPAVGTPVVGFGPPGGWAERRALSVAELAEVPADVDLGLAAALPAAGTTALRAIRRLGLESGQRLLVTGASGGVGRFAVQLAAVDGLHVIAQVGSTARGAGLTDLGAAEVLTSLDDLEPVDGVLDHVAGDLGSLAFTRLVPGGTMLAVGSASGQPTSIDWEEARLRAPGSGVETFSVGAGFGPDLAELVSRLAAGALDPQVGWRGDWSRAGEAADALLGRQVAGKAVIEVG